MVIALKKEVRVKRERYDKGRTSRYGKSGGGYRSEREHRHDRTGARYGRSGEHGCEGGLRFPLRNLRLRLRKSKVF